MISNEKKREKFQNIKENFYYFYTLFDPEVLAGEKNLFLHYRSDLSVEDKMMLWSKEELDKLWKTIYGGNIKSFKKDKNLDTFKMLAQKPMFIKICRLCARYETSKHVIIEK